MYRINFRYLFPSQRNSPH